MYIFLTCRTGSMLEVCYSYCYTVLLTILKTMVKLTFNQRDVVMISCSYLYWSMYMEQL